MNKKTAGILYAGLTALLVVGILCFIVLMYNKPPHKKKAVVFVLTSVAGFFSVFFTMTWAYLWARENDYNFYIDQEGWQYTHTHGWHDYFQTLKQWKPEYSEQYDTVQRFDLSIILDHKNWPSTVHIPNYSAQTYIDVIPQLFIVKNELQQRVDAYVEELGADYISFYVRRGDKVAGELKEMDLHPSEQIINDTDLDTSSATIFIQTDDYSEYEFLQKRYPNRRIMTLTKPSQRGSKNSDMREWTPEQRQKETEELLMSVLVFCKGKQGWTDHRSNVGRFHKLFAFNNVSLYPRLTIKPDRLISPVWDFKEVSPNRESPISQWFRVFK
jgi:hypothetical protein